VNAHRSGRDAARDRSPAGSPGIAALLKQSLDRGLLVGLVGVLLVYALVPVGEIILVRYVEYLVGSFLALVALVLLSATGALVGLEQARQAAARLRTALRDNPAGVEGALADLAGLAVAGILLVTPGFVTDLCGWALLVPSARRAAGRRVAGALAAFVPGIFERLRLPAPARTGHVRRGAPSRLLKNH
jgi:UPF0716 family protein affecting phage T7 exclusion